MGGGVPNAPGSRRAGVLDWSDGDGSDHRAELAEFLRARREAVRPEQVGLPRGRGRRTPGLRREEVALLAGVSVTWYTWLEQGRRINASPDVLAAIGRALRLDETGQGAPARRSARAVAVASPAPVAAPSALVRADHVDRSGAGVRARTALGVPRLERGRGAAVPAIEELDGLERNLMWVLFADPYTQD